MKARLQDFAGRLQGRKQALTLAVLLAVACYIVLLLILAGYAFATLPYMFQDPQSFPGAVVQMGFADRLAQAFASGSELLNEYLFYILIGPALYLLATYLFSRFSQLPMARSFVVVLPFLWLCLFFLLPFFIVLKISFAEAAVAIPPYTDVFAWANDKLTIGLNLGNYVLLGENLGNLSGYLASFKIAMISMVIACLLGFSLAYHYVRHAGKGMRVAIMLVLIVIAVLAVIGWQESWLKGLSSAEMFNAVLVRLGMGSLFNESGNLASYIGLTLSYTPFLAALVWFNLSREESSVIPATATGESCWSHFLRSLLSISKNGILLGGILIILLEVAKFLVSFSADSMYVSAYLGSLRIALISTLLCLAVGYPMAYAIARARKDLQVVLLLLIMMPAWTAILIRVYAWMGILGNNGVLNNFLMAIGLIDSPIQILNTNVAVYIGIVYSYLPFMIMPLYANLVKHDQSLLEAASDLGSSNINSFWRITVPLSKNGIIAGCMLVFIPAVGEFVIPELLGGPQTLMIGKVLWEEFFNNRDWPVASALAVVMLLILIVPIIMFNRNQAKEMEDRP